MLKVIVIIALVIFLLAIGPFLIVWSWNTLFGAALLRRMSALADSNAPYY